MIKKANEKTKMQSMTLEKALELEIAGVTIDHSLLKYKKELLEYGFCVGKISMKEETVSFQKVQ